MLLAVRSTGPVAAAITAHLGGGAPSPEYEYARYDNIGGVGDRTSFITASTNAALGSGTTASNLIDGGYANNSTDSVEINDGQSDRYFRFDFGAGVRKKITAFVWWKSNTSDEGSWKLQASDDASTWVDITGSVVTNVTMIIGNSTGANDGFYRYYQLLQVSGTTENNPWQQEFEFRIVDGDGGDNRLEQSPSYSNYLGSGDRRGHIIIGGDIVWAQNKYAIFDGNTSTTGGGAYVNNGQTGRYIEFDFGCDCLITELKWYQYGSTDSQGNWKWQYYDKVLTSWVDVGSPFELGGALLNTITEMSGMTTYHRLYRLQQTSGSTDSSPYIPEVEFKIGFPALVDPVRAIRTTALRLQALTQPDTEVKATAVRLQVLTQPS